MTAIPNAAETFCRSFDVSRETSRRLDAYVALLERWRRRINLVGPASVDELWSRHVADCAQLARMDRLRAQGGAATWLDIGSGAGLPGIVVALMIRETGGHVHLVESNAKKCAFLREAVRETGAPASVHCTRMETLDSAALHPPVELVTARAVAPLHKLVGLAYPLLQKGVVGVFPKGQDVDRELTEAAKYWRLRVEKHPSRVAGGGVIVIVREASRVR